MNRFIVVLLAALALTGPAMAAEAEVNADAGVQTSSEQGFFSSAWASVKGFFGGGDEESEPEAEETPEPVAEEEDSMIDKAADATKSGVDWTADKAKKGAEWTAETAVDVKDDAVGGAKAVGSAVKEGATAVGGAVKGAFTSDTEVAVDAEASAETK